MQSLSGQWSVAGLTQVDPVNCENKVCWAPAFAATPIAAATNISPLIASRVVIVAAPARSLSFRREGPLTHSAQIHFAFHRVLVLDRARVRHVEMRALHISTEHEGDRRAFDGAREIDFAKILRR